MNNPLEYFNFKHFRILQNSQVFKFGTDAMLLGASIQPLANTTSIMDIGCGTGVVTLMQLQKLINPVDVYIIDIEPQAISLAKQNIEESDFEEKIKSIQYINKDMNDISDLSQKIDLIYSNPPYYQPTNYKRINEINPTDSKKFVAKSENFMPLDSLLLFAKNNLSKEGSFWMNYPYNRWTYFMNEIENSGLYVHHIVKIKSFTHSKEFVRVIVALQIKHPITITQSEFAIYKSTNNFSDDYLELTKDYHH